MCTIGDAEAAKGRTPELIVPLLLFGPPKLASSRGGVFMGECRPRDPRWGYKASSSALRAKPDLPNDEPWIAIGFGSGRGDLGIGAGTEGRGMGVADCDFSEVVGLVRPEAETVDVSG